MIFGPGKFGHPFHGLWRAADNKIQGAHGVALDLPGVAPAMGDHHDQGGDCYRVQVPGQPAVDTTDDETAAGLTWTNYGLASGYGRRLYGKALGSNAWLYVAPDKSVWGVTISYATNAFTLTFKTFGQFGGQAVSQVIPCPVTGFDVGGTYRAIEDIWIDGGAVLISCHDWVDYPPYHGAIRQPKGVIKIAITGTPPAATAMASVAVSYSQADPPMQQTASREWLRVVWDDTVYPHRVISQETVTTYPPMTQMPVGQTQLAVCTRIAGSVDAKDCVVGAAFDGDGQVVAVKISTETIADITSMATPRQESHVIDVSGTGTASTTITFAVGEQTHQLSITSSFTASGSTSLDGGGGYSVVGSYQFDGKTGAISAHYSGVPSATWDEPMRYDCPLVTIGAGVFFSLGQIAGQPISVGFDFRRLAQGLFGLTQWQWVYGSNIPASEWRHRELISRDGIVARDVTNSGQFDAYASRHPVTGVVAFSDQPVCWV